MGDHPATPVSNSALSSTTSSTNTNLNGSASGASTTVFRAKPPIDIDTIREFPMVPSGREEYLKRQGGTDELVKGLDNLHATSESIFRAQKEEILLRRHQINTLKEQCRKYQETLCLNKLNQEREHTCPGCGNLAWEPRVLRTHITSIATKLGKVPPSPLSQ
ncbi:hypothetical protein F5877DRAFT_69202 [Lentinula edodes]|nr:hypothetical protein F5877DRAFT_69202 [Lentinula edodes]